MADIFREVDEEVRQDRIQLALSRYWGWLLLAALLVMAGVGAWRGYDYLREQREEAASTRYIDALALVQDGKVSQGIASLDGVAQTGTPGYAMLSRFRAASETGLTNAADGAKAFDTLAADPKVEPALQDVARLRAAVLLIDSADLKTVQGRLQGLADANNPMRNVARELLALSALKANDDDAASRALEAIVADPTASDAARQRAEILLGVAQSRKSAKTP